jgi:hypothetical protein
LLALGALIWDFYKWRYSERVRLKVFASGGYVTTANPNEELINISITNIGKVGTTIQAIALHGFNSKKEMKKRYGKDLAIIPTPLFNTLPARLEPGNQWNACIKQNTPEIRGYLKFEHFIIQVEDTISGTPFRAEIDKSIIQKSPEK